MTLKALGTFRILQLRGANAVFLPFLKKKAPEIWLKFGGASHPEWVWVRILSLKTSTSTLHPQAELLTSHLVAFQNSSFPDFIKNPFISSIARYDAPSKTGQPSSTVNPNLFQSNPFDPTFQRLVQGGHV